MRHRAPRPGYREHDHVTEWQECDTCGLRTGEGLYTDYDAAYYAGDPSICPRCADRGRDGLMCLPETTSTTTTAAVRATRRKLPAR